MATLERHLPLHFRATEDSGAAVEPDAPARSPLYFDNQPRNGRQAHLQTAHLTAEMVRAGGPLNDLTLVADRQGAAGDHRKREQREPAKRERRDAQGTRAETAEIDHLLKVMETIPEAYPKNREAFARDVIKTRNEIVSGKDPQAALSDGPLREYLKGNPHPEFIAGALTTAMRDDPKAKSINVMTTSDSIIIRDDKAVSDLNPAGVIAAIPTGRRDTPEGRVSMDTARDLLRLGRSINFRGDTFNEILDAMRSSGELAGVPDLPPRPSFADDRSIEQKEEELNDAFKGILSKDVLKTALEQADRMAFKMSGRDLGREFSRSVELLVGDGLDRQTATGVLSESLNIVTKSQDFSTFMNLVGGALVVNLADKRLASSANPAGRTDAKLIRQFNSADSDADRMRLDFEDALEAASILKMGNSKLGPNVSEIQVKQFIDDTVSTLATFGYRSF
jgi:hypothetical protein